MPRLGVNIDHIATLREARKIDYPDPLESLPILANCQVDQITCHLREDRRHIQDHDLARFLKADLLPVNLEMALTQEMIEIARRNPPATVTLVPEKREEITTEGGLNLVANKKALAEGILRLQDKGIRVSLFIDPDLPQIEIASQLKVEGIELHTGAYAEAYGTPKQETEFRRLEKATKQAVQAGVKVFAGHGLNWKNLAPLVSIQEIEEYNIGHSIIGRAIFIGLERAILEIKEILCYY